MRYESLADVKGVENLYEVGGTGYYSESAYTGLRIRVTDDGEYVFVQYSNGDNLDNIEIAEIEYYGPTPLVLDILNTTEDEFDESYGELVQGFVYKNVLYLLLEFISDDY